MTKILIVEDHEIVRDGISILLKKVKGFSIVGVVGTGKEGIALIRKQHPDVVILDFQLPDNNGLELIRKIMQYRPDTKILILTANKNKSVILHLLKAGAAGYLSKEQGFSELERAIQTISRGQHYISPDMASILALDRMNPEQKTPFDTLSTKEMEVALLISKVLTPNEIAEHLHIAKKTVHSYRYRVFEKLNIKNDLELLRLALQSGVIKLDKDLTSSET